MSRLLCFVLFIGCVFCSEQDDIQHRILELERRQNAMEKMYLREIDGLKHELQEMKKSADYRRPTQSICNAKCRINMAELRGRMDEMEYRYFNRSRRLLSADIVGQSPVAFYAHLSSNHPTTGYKQPIVFETDVTNVGNAYEPTNGIFIAPVSGVYAFFWNILNDKGADIHTSLTSSSQGILGSTYTSRSTGVANEGSGFVLVHLNQGTHVWVEKEEGFGDFLQTFSSFSGFLLYLDS